MTPGVAVVAGVLADRYRLTSRIAAGGMGEVWRAQDLLLERPVALKLLRADLVDDDAFRARFRAEARAAARLTHPGIASVYDFGETHDRAWLVLELVEGEPLSALLAREGRLSSERTLDLVAQTASALHAAHEAGVVHRDVKPGNLLVRADGTVKVTDFGIASSTGAATLTRTGEIVGTAGYLSPEQADGRGATAASDLYALGVVAYECLAGSRPFVADTPVAVLFAHLQSAPPDLPPDVPEPVRGFVLRLLAKDPAQRPGPGAAVAAEASSLLRRTPPAARSAAGSTTRVLPPPAPVPSASPRSDRTAGRGVTSRRTQRRAVRATAVVLALLAVVLGGESVWSRSVQVPDIAAGTPAAEATATVREAGLDPSQEQATSDDVAAGLVLGQRPGAGTQVEPGSQVVLVVSSGPTDGAAPASTGPTESGRTVADPPAVAPVAPPAARPEEGGGQQPDPEDDSDERDSRGEQEQGESKDKDEEKEKDKGEGKDKDEGEDQDGT